MADRIRQIAQEVAKDSYDMSEYPQMSGLAAFRGDFRALQRELVEEAAYSMGSSARRLEASLEALSCLDVELSKLGPNAEGRGELVKRFNEQREDALLRLHYVRIQREALGFVRHEELEEHYRVPPKKT
jgi:hypothetical protein